MYKYFVKRNLLKSFKAINEGVHVITISWGKVTSLQVFCDTNYLLGYFDALKQLGIDEASSKPIED